MHFFFFFLVLLIVILLSSNLVDKKAKKNFSNSTSDGDMMISDDILYLSLNCILTNSRSPRGTYIPPSHQIVPKTAAYQTINCEDL